MRRRQFLLLALALILSACALPAADPGPPPTPTSVLAPYDRAVATAEAGDDPPALAAAFYERGNAQFDLGDYQAAIADYGRAAELDPANARALNNRALARAALGDTEGALADYEAAIAIDPAYVRARQNRLRILEQQAAAAPDPAALLRLAAADYASLAELLPEAQAEYRYREGAALARAGDPAAARAALDAALRADPQQPDARYERALLSFAAGDPAAALADLDAALRLSPRAANAYYARALVHEARGEPELALADLGRAIELREGAYPEARLARAALHLDAGRAAEAAADLDALEALTLDETLAALAEGLRARLPAP